MNAEQKAELERLKNHPPLHREIELSEEYQCRANHKRMAGQSKYAGRLDLLERFCIELVDPDNEDKLFALMALKRMASWKAGQTSWRKALKWLLFRWQWVCTYNAALQEMVSVPIEKPLILENPTEQDDDVIQELLWHLLPKIDGHEGTWRKKDEEEFALEEKIRGTCSLAVASDLKISEEAVRQRHLRAKRKG